MTVGTDDGQIIEPGLYLAIGIGKRAKMMHLAELSA